MTRAIQLGFLLSGLRHPTTGEAIANGTVSFVEAGTSTPKSVWEEKEKTNAFTSYTLSGIGTAELYGEGLYDVIVTDENDDPVKTLYDIRLEFPYYGNRSVITTTTQLSEDDLLRINTTAGTVTINCLPASDWLRPLKMMRVAGTNPYIITPNGAETIDDAASLTVNSDSIVEVVTDGSNLITAGFRSASVSPDGNTSITVEDDTITYEVDGETIAVMFDDSGVNTMSIAGLTNLAGGFSGDYANGATEAEVTAVCDLSSGVYAGTPDTGTNAGVVTLTHPSSTDIATIDLGALTSGDYLLVNYQVIGTKGATGGWVEIGVSVSNAYFMAGAAGYTDTFHVEASTAFVVSGTVLFRVTSTASCTATINGRSYGSDSSISAGGGELQAVFLRKQ